MEQITATAMANPQEVTGCAVADLEDFDALVLAEQRRIYRVLLAMLRDPDAADSLTQECFLKAYRAPKAVPGRMQHADVADAHRRQSRSGSREEPPLAVLAQAFQRARGLGGETDLKPVDPQASPERIFVGARTTCSRLGRG